MKKKTKSPTGIAAHSHPPRISRAGERRRGVLSVAAPPALLAVVVALLATVLPVAEARAQDLASDRAALVALYNATDGPKWANNDNWLSDEPLDAWYGVRVSDGRVELLDLEDNRLTGTIPPELGGLTSLTWLNLARNQLTGPIPPELGDLSSLTLLYLHANQLTGSIPPELGDLSRLWTLILAYNQLTGPIPSELGGLSRLRQLGAPFNQLTGSIPPELGDLSRLMWLDLYQNQLTGSIPPELGGLSHLERLYLNHNQLTGPIPPELGGLSSLTLLDFQYNRLTGAIPSELGALSGLEEMDLNDNRLTGSVPRWLGELSKLRSLRLHENQLTGGIPAELGDLTRLIWLYLSRNRLTGNIPPELGSLSSLSILSLTENQLTGRIPAELGGLSSLTVLGLAFNQFTGTIPSSFANLAALDTFWFFMNPGLCAGEDAIIRNWLNGVRNVVGPDCSPSITLSATPSNLVEGSGATPVTVTATQTAVSNRTSVSLLFGGTATTPGDGQDYRLEGSPGSFNAIRNYLTISANSTSGSRILTFVPLADSLVENTENVILQAFVGGSLPDLRGAIVGGTAILTLNDPVGCASGDRAALEALYRATGGINWIDSTNWLSSKPLSEWHGVTVDESGCVTHLDLSNNQLSRTLPSELGDLVNLEALDLSGNFLRGIIPPSFTGLVALKRFRFHLNSGLCAQADTSIRNWLDGVGDVRGSDCSPSQTTSSIFVPVIVKVPGRNNSFFTTELALTNRGSEEATLYYTYTDSGGKMGTATDSLPPGRQAIETDAIGYLTDLGVPISGNPLLVTRRIGTLSVEASGSSEVSVVARTTTAVPEGRAGLAYPGIAENEGFQEPVYLCGLRQNAQDRSNVAVQNMGVHDDELITLRITVFSGEATDSRRSVLPDLTLGPGEFFQHNEVLKKALGGAAQGYVKVEKIDDGDAPFYAYGVINDNFNSDGSFVFPVTESSLVGTGGQTLPVILETGSFRSELTVTNFSASEKTIDFSFVADAVGTADDTATFSLELKAGEQGILPDLIGWLRNQEVDGIGPAGRHFVGALFATPAEGDMSGIVIGARTGAPDRRGGQYSLFYNAVPYGAASMEGAWIYGLQQDEENRSNLALVNTGEIDDSPITLEITIYDGDGELEPSTKSVTLKPRRWHQENGILGRIRQGWVRVVKTSGNNPFVTYGVVNDGGRPGERSGDGAYVPAGE